MSALFHCLVCRSTCETWQNVCPKCGRFNSFSVQGGGVVIKSTTTDVAHTVTRQKTGCAVFDAVMHGGIVMNSCVLIAGIAGGGKSTMILEVAGGLAREGLRVAYVCAEEDPGAVVDRARRVGAVHDRLDLIRTTDASTAIEIAGSYDVAVYDSIQKLGVTAGLLLVPRTRILVSQLNKLGVVAGERGNEHDPDVLAFCDYSPEDKTRALSCTKNRHGELMQAPYTLGEFGVAGMPCKTCNMLTVPCKCPPKKKRRRGEEERA